MSKTTFSDKCNILADLWVEWRNTKMFGDFIEYNDMGLPLSLAISEGMATATTTGQASINETWSMLLEILGTEDKGFANLDEVLDASTLDFD